MSPNISEAQMDLAEQLEEGAGGAEWSDWRWQLRHTIRSVDEAARILGITFDDETRERLERTVEKFPLAVTPYYLSLVDPEGYADDPVFRQCFPSPLELEVAPHDMRDPLAEDRDSPVPLVTHRYPDRVLFHVSNRCAMYCRHCTRKRKVGDDDHVPTRDEIRVGLDYIRSTPTVRDVLLSGGDPFMLSDETLDWLLGELRSIETVEVIRVGTRTPVVLPQRITPELVAILTRHHPLWVNTHVNHPRELTATVRAALGLLADGGIPLGNQSVLLAGVNDCPRIMKRLVQRLVANRVRPYYMYQCDLSEGLGHFRTPIGKGMEIVESLIGHTSGFAVPTYVVDAPGGGGKIPVMPAYVMSWSTNKVVLRNYEGVITSYKEPDSYEPRFCDRNCAGCQLQLSLDAARETRSVGIARLLDDVGDEISLVPEGCDRMARRDEEEV